MIYRVTIKVSYCKAYFDFDDMVEACAWMAQAEARYSGGDPLEVMMTIVREENDGE